MIYYRGKPIRRILQLSHGHATFLVETAAPRRTYSHVPLERIGADEGADEVLRTAQMHPGEVLEEQKSPAV